MKKILFIPLFAFLSNFANAQEEKLFKFDVGADLNIIGTGAYIGGKWANRFHTNLELKVYPGPVDIGPSIGYSCYLFKRADVFKENPVGEFIFHFGICQRIYGAGDIRNQTGIISGIKYKQKKFYVDMFVSPYQEYSLKSKQTPDNQKLSGPIEIKVSAGMSLVDFLKTIVFKNKHQYDCP